MDENSLDDALVLDTETMQELIKAAVEEAVAGAVAEAVKPIAAKAEKLAKAVVAQSELLNEWAERDEKITKALESLQDVGTLVKSMSDKADAKAKTTPAPKTESAPVEKSEVLEKADVPKPDSKGQEIMGVPLDDLKKACEVLVKAESRPDVDIPSTYYVAASERLLTKAMCDDIIKRGGKLLETPA